MAGVFFFLCLCMIVVIIRWYVKNDALATGGPTKGMLRMKDEFLSAEHPDQSKPNSGGAGQSNGRT